MLCIAHRYILFNSVEVEPYVNLHLQELQHLDVSLGSRPTLLQKKHTTSFATWFKAKMSTEGPSDTSPSSSKRKGRRPNQINFNKIAKAKEVGVTFNELGQPLGDSSIALSTCIGTITTQMIPITYSSWPEVPDVVKNSVWETI
ncbi:hypothetical protein ACOSQ2_010820 [Xanthoceras sorbifolium]